MKLSPTPVVSSLGHSELVIAIAAGYYHTLALTSKGELYTYVISFSMYHSNARDRHNNLTPLLKTFHVKTVTLAVKQQA